MAAATLHDTRTAQEPRRQPAAVMFVDMRGFTALSERLGDENTVPVLRDFHRRVERVVSAHRGVLDNFMGDGVMAIFGLPEPALSDPADALASARRLVAETAAAADKQNSAGSAPISIGIGLHYGPVVIGRVGGERQTQMTASGDTVNVAARLEALTKTHGTPIIASDALIAAVRTLARDDLVAGFTKLPDQEIRGRRERIDLWIWDRAPP